MIAILFGNPFVPFVEEIIRDILEAGTRLGERIQPLPVEQAVMHPAHCSTIRRLYVLPFDVPDNTTRPTAFVRQLFPHADVLNPTEAHEVCWDKLTTLERFLARGIPVPESVYTTSPTEAREFVAHHGQAILKDRLACGGQGHVILEDTDEILVGEAHGRRFVVELADDPAVRRTLRDGVLTYPPPFYLQRLIGGVGPRGVFVPGQVLRAYVVDRQLVFWAERYRTRYHRPSDWIISVGLGARYRFVLETSEEIRKIAVRAADVLGVRVGVVDLVCTGSTGPYVLGVNTDGYHMYIDRQFKHIPDFRDPFDFDRMIAAALVAEVEQTPKQPDGVQ